MNTETMLLQPYQISRAVYRCGLLERKILFYAALRAQNTPECKYGKYTAKFSASEMLKMLGMSQHKGKQGTKDIIKCSVKTIARNSIIIHEDNDKLLVLNWLQCGLYDATEDKIELVFSDTIGEMFVNCREKFSLINPLVIGQLSSFYAIRFYELTLSHRGQCGKSGNPKNTWWCTYSLDELRRMFEVDGYENTKEFIRNVISNPIRELNSLNPEYEITIEKIRSKNDVRRVESVKLVCKHKKSKSNAPRGQISRENGKSEAMRSKQIAEMQEIEKERANIEALKKAHPEEFNRRLQEYKKANPIALEAFAEQQIFENW